MEDQPSTSKDARNRNDPDEESRDDQGTNSGTTLSNYSDKSLLRMAATAIEKPKPVLGKPDVKFDDKKRKKRRIGRVEKQRKAQTRRQVVRRAPKRKPRAKHDKRRDLSVSTMYSRLSSSGLLTPACERCGHRCCRRSKMLSPLFINTNSVQFEDKPPMMYSEISPEMIFESLRRLTMWKQNVETSEILKYIQMSNDMKKDVAFIKEWMAKEPYLPKDLDEGMIAKFLHSCGGSLERTKKCIDRFCSTRSQMTELYSARDPFAENVKTAFSVTEMFLNDDLWKADLKLKPKGDSNTMNGSFRTLAID